MATLQAGEGGAGQTCIHVSYTRSLRGILAGCRHQHLISKGCRHQHLILAGRRHQHLISTGCRHQDCTMRCDSAEAPPVAALPALCCPVTAAREARHTLCLHACCPLRPTAPEPPAVLLWRDDGGVFARAAQNAGLLHPRLHLLVPRVLQGGSGGATAEQGKSHLQGRSGGQLLVVRGRHREEGKAAGGGPRGGQMRRRGERWGARRRRQPCTVARRRQAPRASSARGQAAALLHHLRAVSSHSTHLSDIVYHAHHQLPARLVHPHKQRVVHHAQPRQEAGVCRAGAGKARRGGVEAMQYKGGRQRCVSLCQASPCPYIHPS